MSKFIKIPIAVEENKNLTMTDKMVYIQLRKYMNNKTYECWPSRKTISEGISRGGRTITNSLANLEREKIIERNLRINATTRYKILCI